MPLPVSPSFLLLGALRQLNPSIFSVRLGNFKNGLDFGHDPQGKTLGILGMIGKGRPWFAALFLLG